MNNYSDREFYALLVHSFSRQSWELFDNFLKRPLGSCASSYVVAAEVLLSSSNGLCSLLESYCKHQSCELSAVEAQNLFCLLNNAKASLERIK